MSGCFIGIVGEGASDFSCGKCQIDLREKKFKFPEKTESGKIIGGKNEMMILGFFIFSKKGGNVFEFPRFFKCFNCPAMGVLLRRLLLFLF